MKPLILIITLLAWRFQLEANGEDIRHQIVTNIYLGANLNHTFFITDDGSYNNKHEVSPQRAEEAKKSRESLPAKDFPEGNWGESVKGFQVSLRFDKQLYTNGEQITATVLVRNATNHILIFADSDGLKPGAVSYLAYKPSSQAVTLRLDHPRLWSPSGTINVVFPDYQKKYKDPLNDSFDLTNGNYLIQALINAESLTESNTPFRYQLKSAKVPVEIR